MQSNATPTRKTARIDVALCPGCFCSIPVDQQASHSKWHQDRTVKVSK